MGQARNWTEEEKNYLAEHWGQFTVPSLCKRLNRSKSAILIMVQKLNLGAYYDSGDYITMHQLLLALGYGDSSSYKNKSWIENRGFPVHKKRNDKSLVKVVYLEEFWEWAEKNQAFLDFSKFEENALGPEADWVKEKRKRDLKNTLSYKKTPWTPQEDAYLKDLLKSHRFNYSEISKRLKRTDGAIQRRINDLGIKERPIKADTHKLWTEDQFVVLGKMIKEGCNYEAIHEEIPDKSVKAIRGYVFRFYLTESLDKVRKYIGDGSFGDNMPERKITQWNCMSIEEKQEVKENVSQLAYLLNQRARQLSPVSAEYKDYFQKDMCMNWSDIHGCKEGKTSCDSCNSFIRIQEQYCVRCGSTIISRSEITICERCRLMRKKQAQRKYSIMSNRQARREE